MKDVFSATTPQISDEEEQQEIDALTLLGQQQIRADLYGDNVNNQLAVTEEMIVEGTRMLHEAIEPILHEDKDSYLHALEACPDVVERETNPELFLRCTDFDPWAAARRLVKYWEMKEKVMGEGAFHPLSCNPGSSPLHPVAIDYIASAGVHLPDDARGRAVILVDRSFLNGKVESRTPISQAFFYGIMTVILESKAAQRNGMVLLSVSQKRTNISMFDRKLSKTCLELLRDCLPVRVRAVHVCQVITHASSALVLPVIRFLCGKHIRRRLVFHNTNGGNNFVESLGRYGIRRIGIPDYMGGSLNVAEHQAAWYDFRCASDLERDEKHHNFLLQLGL